MWLKTLGARTFTGSFSSFHKKLWSWYWAITLKRLRGEPLLPEELAFLAIWFRSGGKSANVEWACIAEGAIVGEGYVMYVCDTEGQAIEHVTAIRDRLESFEIGEYYPGLGSPEVSKHGYQVGWRQDYLATASGWGIIPVGLDTGIRGGRKKDMRFTMIVLDDVDRHDDSPAVVQKKLDIIARSILPAGQRDTIVLFAQNLIHEDSVLNQILTGRSDVLAERIVSGPVPAFSDLELELDGSGTARVWKIKTAVPTWPDIDMKAARIFLARSGRASFMAEYQHDFTDDKSVRVLKNWDDKVHVITWSEFKKVFGFNKIPARWYKYVFNDYAKTKSAYHANVAGMITVSGMHERLPGFVFLYNCMSFPANTEADDVALRIIKNISPTVDEMGGSWDKLAGSSLNRSDLERYVTSATELMRERRTQLARVIPQKVAPHLHRQHFVSFVGSNEQAKGALAVYRQVYGLPFHPVNPGMEDGIEWIDHCLMVDPDRAHPFRPEQMGYSRFFMIVDDEKAEYPTSLLPDDLHDSDLARYQLKHWKNRPVKVLESGVTEKGPIKINDDFGQGLQMVFINGVPQAAPMTQEERITALTSPGYTYDELLEKSPFEHGLLPHQEMAYWFARDRARKLAGKTGIQEFTEWGDPIED